MYLWLYDMVEPRNPRGALFRLLRILYFCLTALYFKEDLLLACIYI